MPEENIRSFISVEFPSEVIKEVCRIQGLLQDQEFNGKLTDPKNLHMTLKFLGEIKPETLKKVQKALSSISFPSMNLRLEQTGLFTKKGKPRIVWVKITGDIFELQKKVDEALKEEFRPEVGFMSHLTIARVKQVNDRERFLNYVNSMSVNKIPFVSNEFKLRSSELNPEGPKYTTLAQYHSKAI